MRDVDIDRLERLGRTSAFNCLEERPSNRFKTGHQRSAYRCLDTNRDEEIRARLVRNWEHHAELRAEFNNDFQRYLRHMKSEVTFC